MLCAIDPDTGIIHFYREFYKKDQVLAQVVTAWRDMVRDIPQGCLEMPLIDPSSKKRSKTTGRSYKQQLQVEYGIVTKEAINDIEDGIQRVKNLMYFGKIRFFNSLTNTIWEGCEYRYPTLEERNNNKNLGDKPLDKNNHLMDCLRYVCQALPYDFLDKSALANANYMGFFEKMRNERDNAHKVLSFNELIDIINIDYANEQYTANQGEFFGGYKL